MHKARRHSFHTTDNAIQNHRTEKGAHTQSVLVSILQTCRQQLRPATGFLERLLHLRTPQALDL